MPSSGFSGRKSSSRNPSDVPHVIRVTVMGLAGVTVHPNLCRSAKGHDGNSSKGGKIKKWGLRGRKDATLPPPPSEMKAIVAFSRNNEIRGTTRLSNPLVRAPSQNQDSGGESNGEAERHVAVWPAQGPNKEPGAVVLFESGLHNTKDEGTLSVVSSSRFCPKSFEVTVALTDGSKVAMPFGVATMVITGEECANGKRVLLDLPVMSLAQANPLGSTSDHYAINIVPPVDATEAENVTHTTPMGGEGKKKKGRLASFLKKRTPSGGVGDNAGASVSEMSTLSVPEKKAFSSAYTMDSNGDAIVRVALEVYEKNSELEYELASQRQNMNAYNAQDKEPPRSPSRSQISSKAAEPQTPVTLPETPTRKNTTPRAKSPLENTVAEIDKDVRDEELSRNDSEYSGSEDDSEDSSQATEGTENTGDTGNSSDGTEQENDEIIGSTFDEDEIFKEIPEMRGMPTTSNLSFDREDDYNDAPILNTLSRDSAIRGAASRDSSIRKSASRDSALRKVASRDIEISNAASRDSAIKGAASRDSAIHEMRSKDSDRGIEDDEEAVDTEQIMKLVMDKSATKAAVSKHAGLDNGNGEDSPIKAAASSTNGSPKGVADYTDKDDSRVSGKMTPDDGTVATMIPKQSFFRSVAEMFIVCRGTNQDYDEEETQVTYEYQNRGPPQIIASRSDLSSVGDLTESTLHDDYNTRQRMAARYRERKERELERLRKGGVKASYNPLPVAFGGDGLCTAKQYFEEEEESDEDTHLDENSIETRSTVSRRRSRGRKQKQEDYFQEYDDYSLVDPPVSPERNEKRSSSRPRSSSRHRGRGERSRSNSRPRSSSRHREQLESPRSYSRPRSRNRDRPESPRASSRPRSRHKDRLESPRSSSRPRSSLRHRDRPVSRNSEYEEELRYTSEERPRSSMSRKQTKTPLVQNSRNRTKTPLAQNRNGHSLDYDDLGHNSPFPSTPPRPRSQARSNSQSDEALIQKYNRYYNDDDK